MRDVLALSWPIMVSMLSFTATSVVDTIFVARLGTQQLAGIGLAITLVFLVHAFPNGLLTGAKVAVAQHTGAGSDELARQVVWHAITLGLLFGVLVASFSGLGSWLLGLLGAERSVLAYGEEFFTIRLLGAPFLTLQLALNTWFHGRSDMRTPMVATLLSNAVNLVLDPILIFGWGPVPAFGVSGAALATIVGFAFGAAFLAVRIRHHISGTERRIDRSILRTIWHLGSPIGLRYLLEVGSFVLFASILAAVGAMELAAHVIVVRIISVSFLPGYAIGEAAGVLVGQAIGAGVPERARSAWRAALRLAMGIMLVMGMVFMIVPDLLLQVFSPAPEVAAIGQNLLIVAALFQVFDAVAMVTISTLNGAGDVRFSMWATVGSAWLLKLPAGWFLAVPVGLGALGAWLGLTLEIVGLSLVVYWRVRGDLWVQKSPIARPVRA